MGSLIIGADVGGTSTRVGIATIEGEVLGLASNPGLAFFKSQEATQTVLPTEGTVLMSSAAPLTAELFRARGLEVVTTPITEFEKLEGCVTCLSVRVRT